MRKINYSLIVSDFDGTLVNEDGSISEKNKNAIAEYVASGGAFAISTGRMPKGILSRARELGLTGLVSCCQGSIIADITTEDFVFEGRISYETTLAIVKKMEAMGLHIHIYDSWDYYCNMDDEALKIYERAVKNKAILVLDKPLSQFVEERKFASYKVLAMVPAEESEDVLNELAAENFAGCALTKSSAYLVEVINAQYSKGTAVEFLADHYNLSLDKTVAVGDQRNDLPMVERAGLGVAVNNADKGLKEKADYICTCTNEEGAVAEVIAKFGFSEDN